MFDKMYNPNLSDLFSGRNIYVRITNRCNFDCNFCYRHKTSRNEPSSSELMRAIEKIRPDFDRINLLGGEVFLRSELFDILEFSKSCGFKEICLSTNGSLLTCDKLDLLNDCVTQIGLPLDSASKELSDKIRPSALFGKTQFDITTAFLNHFIAEKPEYKVKISTLVTKMNVDALLDLSRYLFERNEIDMCDHQNLLPYLSINNLKSTDLKYKVHPKMIEDKFSEIQNYFQLKGGFNIGKIRLPEQKYLILETDGYLYLSSKERQVPIYKIY